MPFVEEKHRDRTPDVRPKRLTIRLEHSPLGSLVNGVFEIGEIPAQVHIFPLRIGTDQARAPETKTAIFKETEAIKPFRIEHLLLALIDELFESYCEIHHFVRRR